MPVAEFTPDRGAAYFFANTGEERSEHQRAWADNTDLLHAEFREQDVSSAVLAINGEDREVSLRSGKQLAGLMSEVPDVLYVDITGLAYQIWAPLVRAAIVAEKSLRCVYVEPGEYTRTSTPTEGTVYDLSETITGIAPLPGFANLTDETGGSAGFVPLLGFEGPRLIHVAEHVQLSGDSMVPVVGAPGFRMEYPFVSLKGNRKPLLDSISHVNTRFATANCPFDAFFTIRRIVEDYQFTHVFVAPIGSKPHGLGAVLFALSAEHRVELIYDHPVRKAGRTSGSDHLCVYDVGMFASSEEFGWAAAGGV